MQKTPVSILQEMMVKKGSVPNYELIHDGGGTHENTFTYKVSCDGLVATGTGRCKKDAKHTAASNMLETIAKHNGFLPLQDSPSRSPVRLSPPLPKPEPYLQNPNEPFLNAIGALQDICADNELMEPVYNTISDIGPPHARVFTMQCTVASFKEEGISTTKKQAKHLAAKKMLERITEVLQDVSQSSLIPLLKTAGEIDDDAIDAANEQSKRIFQNMKGPLTKKFNLGVKLADYHTKLKSLYDETTRQEMHHSMNEFAINLYNYQEATERPAFCDDLMDKFRELLEPLEIEVGEAIIGEDTAVLFLNTVPEIAEVAFGDGKPHWKLQIEVCRRMISTLIDFLS